MGSLGKGGDVTGNLNYDSQNKRESLVTNKVVLSILDTVSFGSAEATLRHDGK